MRLVDMAEPPNLEGNPMGGCNEEIDRIYEMAEADKLRDFLVRFYPDGYKAIPHNGSLIDLVIKLLKPVDAISDELTVNNRWCLMRLVIRLSEDEFDGHVFQRVSPEDIYMVLRDLVIKSKVDR